MKKLILFLFLCTFAFTQQPPGPVGPLELAPAADQTMRGGFSLINDNSGGFVATDSANTTAALTLFMNSGNPGQGWLFYNNPTSGNSSSIRFNPSGAITLNGPSGEADDGTHGIIINTSGLYVAGNFSDGISVILTQGNMQIDGGSLATGNPLLTLGSSGVEGVLKTLPSSGGGSYTIRSPATPFNLALNLPSSSGTLTLTVANGAVSLGTGAITNGTCATAATASASGTLTTDTINFTFSADPTGVTGYNPAGAGPLTVYAYPTANQVNFKVCNFTAGSITPGAITLNWRVAR